MSDLASLFLSAAFAENMPLTFFLGLCTFLALSRRPETAVGLGVAMIGVLGLTVPLNQIIYEVLLAPGACPTTAFDLGPWAIRAWVPASTLKHGRSRTSSALSRWRRKQVLSAHTPPATSYSEANLGIMLQVKSATWSSWAVHGNAQADARGAEPGDGRARHRHPLWPSPEPLVIERHIVTQSQNGGTPTLELYDKWAAERWG